MPLLGDPGAMLKKNGPAVFRSRGFCKSARSVLEVRVGIFLFRKLLDMFGKLKGCEQ